MKGKPPFTVGSYCCWLLCFALLCFANPLICYTFMACLPPGWRFLPSFALLCSPLLLVSKCCYPTMIWVQAAANCPSAEKRAPVSSMQGTQLISPSEVGSFFCFMGNLHIRLCWSIHLQCIIGTLQLLQKLLIVHFCAVCTCCSSNPGLSKGGAVSPTLGAAACCPAGEEGILSTWGARRAAGSRFPGHTYNPPFCLPFKTSLVVFVFFLFLFITCYPNSMVTCDIFLQFIFFRWGSCPLNTVIWKSAIVF